MAERPQIEALMPFLHQLFAVLLLIALFFPCSLFLCTQRALNKPSHDTVPNTYNNPFAATTLTRYNLLSHRFSPDPENQKKGNCGGWWG